MCLPLFCFRSYLSWSLGDYDVGETLGRGVFGRVQAAKHKITGEIVALKLIDRADYLLDGLSSFRAEVDALVKLSNSSSNSSSSEERCPVVHLVFYSPCEVLDRGVFFGRRSVAVLGMERAKGTLEDCLEYGGSFQPDMAITLFAQVLEALDYCHSRDVCHRDVKPANLLISEDYRLLLTDFGLASTRRYCRRCCGTLRYMAPEVAARGAMQYDAAKADVWSAGVCLFLCAIGREPYYCPERGVDVRFKCIVEGKWDDYWELYCPLDIPEVVRDLLAMTLVSSPAKRPSAAELLTHIASQKAADHREVACELRRRLRRTK